MNWRVIYRTDNGRQKEEVFEAEDRTALFNVLSTKGIKPVRVLVTNSVAVKKRVAWIRHRRTIWAVAGVGAVVLLAALWFALSTGRRSNPPDSPKKPLAPLKDVSNAQRHVPILANKTNEAAVAASTPKMLTREEILKKPHWTLTEEERGVVDPSYPERHKQFMEEQAKIPWRTHVDRELALLLFPKDGNTGLLIPFDRKFVNRFAESIATPTLVLSDDSDELKEKKRTLNEVKAYLKERMDAGEDIVQLLNDEYKRLKKLYGLRESLKRELREYVKTAESWDDVDDLVKAANTMLDKAGGRHIKLPIDIKIKREPQMKGKQE